MGFRCVAFCIIINYVFFVYYLLCLNKRSVNEIFYNYFQYISKGADISFDDPPPPPHHTFCLLLFIGKRFTIWGSLGNCLWTLNTNYIARKWSFIFYFFFAILTWIIIENSDMKMKGEISYFEINLIEILFLIFFEKYKNLIIKN